MQQTGVLRMVSPEGVTAQEQKAQADKAQAMSDMTASPDVERGVIGHIRKQFQLMRDHRESSGLGARLLAAQRAFNGEYDPATISQIKQFGGSEVYARLTSQKARGATSLLRDIYFSAGRPWSLSPTDDPKLPDDIAATIPRVVQAQAAQEQAQGAQVSPMELASRVSTMMDEAHRIERKKAVSEAKKAERRVNDLLQEGGFYDALNNLLVDIPLFPYVVMKGPFVRMADDIEYGSGGSIRRITKPKLFWARISPFDLFFTPGVSNIRDAATCERLRWTRRDLNDLLGVPGWNEDAVRSALNEYDNGLRDWMTTGDAAQAIHEDREDPTFNRSAIIDAMEYHGNIKGSTLVEFGMDEKAVPDTDKDYFVEAWVVGVHVLKVQMSPSPRRRAPYALASFEKVPGTIVGHSLTDMLSDVQEVANAALRALVNNMSMASGPQVTVFTNRIAENEDPSEIYPWKRWLVQDDLLAAPTTVPPIGFFQPQSNANELLGIYQKMTDMADEISAIPRYLTGSGASGGAGRTASGLSMLIGNASKMLQQVAHNIDLGPIKESIEMLYDLLMISDAGVELRGDEDIVVNGVTSVLAKDVERARQLEFLSLTANPIDQQILGVEGRATVLREIADGLGLPGSKIVPSEKDLAQRQQQALAAQSASAQAQATGNGNQPPAPAKDTGPVTNTVQPGFGLGGLQGG